jgi:hypothetical protein
MPKSEAADPEPELNLDHDRVFKNSEGSGVGPKPAAAEPDLPPLDDSNPVVKAALADLSIDDYELEPASPRLESLLEGTRKLLPPQRGAPKKSKSQNTAPWHAESRETESEEPDAAKPSPEKVEGIYRPDRSHDKPQNPKFGRRFQLPSTVVAAGALESAVASPGTAKAADGSMEFQVNRAQEIFAVIDPEEVLRADPSYVGMILKRLLLCGLGVMLCYFFWIFARRQKSDFGEAAEVQPARPLPERQRLARAALISYISSVTPEERAKRVISGDTLLEKMRKYYVFNADPDFDATQLQELPPKQIGRDFWFGFTVGLRGGGSPARVMLKETVDFQYLVDWEALADSSSQTWKDFLAKRPAESTQLRAEVQPSSAYGQPYDAEKFLCYQLSNPAGQGSVIGFAARQDRVAQTLQAQVKEGLRPVAMRLYLKFEPEAGSEGRCRIVDIGDAWSSTN